MAAEKSPVEGVHDTFEAAVHEYPRREEYTPVSESCSTSTRPKCAKSSMADCASHVEAWINEEFGDDDEGASLTMHGEADINTTLRLQVLEYIEVEELSHTAAHSIFDDLVDEDSKDSEMYYEPQLWSFPR